MRRRIAGWVENPEAQDEVPASGLTMRRLRWRRRIGHDLGECGQSFQSRREPEGREDAEQDTASSPCSFVNAQYPPCTVPQSRADCRARETAREVRSTARLTTTL